jgi:hypothetical protein
MRLIPDGPDRSPNVLWLLYFPAILFWFSPTTPFGRAALESILGKDPSRNFESP